MRLPAQLRLPAIGWAPVATSALLLFTGAMVAVQPIAAVGVLALALLAAALSRTARLPAVFLQGTGLVLVGYAFLGKGFAYFGQSPVFIGDIVLLIGLLALLTRARGVAVSPVQALIGLFVTLGALRTLPYVGIYHVDAIRDAALWGYCLYAIALSVFLTEAHILRALQGYRRLVPWLLLWIPVAAAVASVNASPRWPNSGIPLVVFKGGDMGVHLTLAAAFILLGLYTSDRARGLRSEATMWLLWCAGLAAVVSQSRSAMIATSAGITAAFAFRRTTRIIRLVGAGIALFVVLIAINPNIPVGHGQSLSIADLSANAISIVVSKQDQTADQTAAVGASHQNLQGSKKFRLAWWGKIIDYTFKGPYFWKGKGFGINLADADGFQVDRFHSLRAPHNSHLTVLARMGVPGLALWSLIQVMFAGSLIVWFRRARRHGARLWSLVDAWLFVAWLAIAIDTSFDPYLEGPQGAIWFWSVIGAGLAAIRLQRVAFARGLPDLGSAP